MSVQIGSTLKKFDISSPEGKKNFDFTQQTSGIKYYEDITDTSIHLTIGIQDVFGRFNKLPVRSGNKVSFEIESNGATLSLEDLMISNIIGYNPEAKRETYALVMETNSAFENHTTRVFEKYTGKISDSVTKIMKDKLGVDMFDIDDTNNNYEFVGGYRRPLLACTWLAKKSIDAPTSSDTKGSAGFLFYQTQDGYHFKSIDGLFKKAKDDEGSIVKYEYKIDKDTNFDALKNLFTVVSQPVVESSHNILQQLNAGHYKTANWYYDIITRKPAFVEYSYRDSASEEMEISADETVTPKLDENYSRIILQTVDRGCLSVKGDLTATSDQYYYQAQATTRYSSLFSQRMKVTVPINLKLRAGQVIFLKLPEINSTRLSGPQSGLYLISKLCHEFGGDKDFTGLELVRDSYQELA